MIESRIYREGETETTSGWENPFLASLPGSSLSESSCLLGWGVGVGDRITVSQIMTNAVRVGETSSAPFFLSTSFCHKKIGCF